MSTIAFGDLFLRDIREYRERQLKGTGLEPLFPLWDLPSRALATEMIDAGIRAKVICVDPKRLDRSYAGRDFDPSFVADWHSGVVLCGENGEFHTFVYDAPEFSSPINIFPGDVVERDGFGFADLSYRQSGQCTTGALDGCRFRTA